MPTNLRLWITAAKEKFSWRKPNGLCILIPPSPVSYTHLDVYKRQERGHELENCSFKDKILVFQSTKGSSGTSGMLKWSKINGVAPRAFINSDLDALAVLSCVACKFPMVAEPEEDVFSIIKTGDWVKVDATNGIIEVTHKE